MRSNDITGATTRGASEDQETSKPPATEAPEKRGVMSAAIVPEGPPAPPLRDSAAETSDLGRRVLAHERILQSLIAHMTEYDPRFLERLKQSFSEPVKMVRREQDYTDTEDYAEEFIRAVVRMGDQLPRDKLREPAAPLLNAAAMPRGEGRDAAVDTVLPADVRVRERSGVWEVRVNGSFHGDYRREEHAVDAAALAARRIALGAGNRTRADRGS